MVVESSETVPRPAVCMVCLWAWASGVPESELARCPKCGCKSGTPAFLERTPPNWLEYRIYGPPEQLNGWIDTINASLN